jgi:hypothetical protein
MHTSRPSNLLKKGMPKPTKGCSAREEEEEKYM